MVDDAPRPEHSPSPTSREHSVERLLSLLERAEKGSRELDGAVWMATRVRWNQVNFFHWRHMLPKGDPQGTEQHYAEERAPSFTTSIDAALTLVPEGWFWRAGRTVLYAGWAFVQKEYDNERTEFWFGKELNTTPALALVIAALRARAAK